MKKRSYITYRLNEIVYIRKCISLQKNTTYWAKVNTRLKRIAKVYYDSLKDLDVEVQLIRSATQKLRCSGFTKLGLRCKRYDKGNYCFQHRKISSMRFDKQVMVQNAI
jgi:hypothetical protein